MSQQVKLLPPPRYLVWRTPANIIKAYQNDLGDNRSSQKQTTTRTQQKSARRQKPKPPPFAAKVRRKWSDTKSKVRKRLGLYTFLDPMPTGLYLDIVI
jgi:hypothetical protein